MIYTIYTGLSTDTEQAVAVVANSLELKQFGWVSKGFHKLHFSYKETSSVGYQERCILNVTDTDATLMFGSGNKIEDKKLVFIIDTCKEYQKPFFYINMNKWSQKKCVEWLNSINPKKLHVTGPNGIYREPMQALAGIIIEHNKIKV